MKVAVLSESAEDEAAIRILVPAILGQAIDTINTPVLRSRGWPAVRDVVPAVLAHLHTQSDVDAFVVVADADYSVVHSLVHEEPKKADRNCHLCQLRAAVEKFERKHKSTPERPAILTAVGTPVPCIEAWYLYGKDRPNSEAAWINRAEPGSKLYTRNDLKRWVYGTERPDQTRRKRHAVEEATRLAGFIGQLESSFPGGFAPFARDVRSWLA